MHAPTEAGGGRLLWPVMEAAYLLGCGRSKVYELVKRGQLKMVKIDDKSLITDTSISAFVSSLSSPDAASD